VILKKIVPTAAIVWVLSAADTTQTAAWKIIVESVRSRGPDQAAAIEALGSINTPASRQLTESILGGKDSFMIAHLVKGLSARQSASLLPQLAAAAREVNPSTSLQVLAAIARAQNIDAARALGTFVGSGEQPRSGVAFGLLESMGAGAEPVLIDALRNGATAWTRETAGATLRRLASTSAIPAFRSALGDPDENVRSIAAVALARFGIPDGLAQLKSAAAKDSSPYQTAAMVALAALGQSDAIEKLKTAATSADRAVRNSAVWEMAWSGSQSIKQLAYALGLDRDVVSRDMLAEKLLDSSDPRDASVLHDMLDRGGEMSQLIAAQRLLPSGSFAAKLAVSRALDSQDVAVRAFALKLASGDPALRSDLARYIGSSDPEVQLAALSAAADLHQGQIAEISPYLSSPDRRISLAAARALVAIDPVAAGPILEKGIEAKGNLRVHSAALLAAALTQ